MKDLWVSVSGAVAQQKNVETIANNVANANTPGFKKDQLVFKEYLTAIEKGTQDIDLPQKEWAPEDFYRSYGAEDAFVKADGTYTNHEQGRLTPTGNHFDVALVGPGFFEVLTPAGQRFTRRGTFTLSKDGVLVTDQGHPVLGKGEENLDNRTIVIGNEKLSINLQGEVFAGKNKVADLNIVEFKDINSLKKEGHSLFINDVQDNIIKDNTKTVIQQGFVEESNVNAIVEMSNLIKANRNFESIQRAIKTYDNITSRSVNDISKF